jgi:hypothetical protein
VGTDPGGDRARHPLRGGRCVDDGPGGHRRGAPGRQRLPHGGELGDYEDLLEGFEPAENVIAALVPTDQRGPVGLA